MQAANHGGATPEVAVVIVNYRSAKLVADCVASLRRQQFSFNYEVIVVDNASGDGSIDVIRQTVPNVIIVESPNNDGFGSGVNKGIAAASGRYILVLNPDTEFIDTSLERALQIFAEDDRLAIVGLDLHYPDGTRQFSGRRFYSLLDVVIRRTPLKILPPFSIRNRQHLMTSRWSERFFYTDWVLGTGFVARRDALDDVGGMDDDFFMYMEDVDLCWRLWDKNWRVAVAVNAVLIHHHQRDSAQSPFSRSARWHLASLRTFRRKHSMPLFLGGYSPHKAFVGPQTYNPA